MALTRGIFLYICVIFTATLCCEVVTQKTRFFGAVGCAKLALPSGVTKAMKQFTRANEEFPNELLRWVLRYEMY